MTDKIASISLQNTMSMQVCEELRLPKKTGHLSAPVSKPSYCPKKRGLCCFFAIATGIGIVLYS